MKSQCVSSLSDDAISLRRVYDKYVLDFKSR
jgi:hypothetical protein